MKRILSILLCLTCLSFAFAQNYDETVGVRYFNEEQYSQALPFLQRAAKAGSLKALDCLGQMYGNGWGVEKNKTIMRNMYNRAIQANYAPSMYNMAFAVDDDQEMLRLLKKAASLDNGLTLQLKEVRKIESSIRKGKNTYYIFEDTEI